MLVGHIKEIVRHPVKSLYGESVRKSKIMEYGLYGDRSHAYLDETKKGKFFTIKDLPEMAGYQARFAGEESLEKYPKVEIELPDGRVFDWEEEAFIKEMENQSNGKISTIEYSPSYVPIGPIAEEHIQLVTDASLDKIEETWGEQTVDVRRFRPNLFISLKEKIPFVEDEWLGKRIKIGREVEIELIRHCTRCMIITVNPDNAEKDASLHKTVMKERENRFGVYASVIKTGDIHVDDEVHLLE